MSSGVVLHPNLARVAALYQQLTDRFARGEIDVVEVNARIRELHAKDDDGVVWMINPADGKWLFRSVDGSWKPGTPPTFGLATLTAHDVSQREAFGAKPVYNPDTDISFARVDERTTNLGSFQGATRRALIASKDVYERPRWLYPVIATVVGFFVLVFVVIPVLDRGEPAMPTIPDAPLSEPVAI